MSPKIKAILLSLALIPVAACEPAANHTHAKEAAGATASADLFGISGTAIGTADMIQAPTGVLIRVNVEDLTPGAHGLHIHDHAMCEPDTGFTSAKGHHGKVEGAHGLLNPKGPEAGDLPNIFVGADGRGQGEFFTTLISLNTDSPLSIFDDSGASFIIHENADDHITQPIGGAGKRVACGIISAG